MIKNITRISAVGVLSVSIMILGGCTKDGAEQKKDAVSQEAITVEGESQDEQLFKGGIQGLLAMGKPQKCEWKSDDENGVTYIDGKRMRADMLNTAVADSKESAMSMINDGTWMYSWDTITKRGQKFKIADMERMQKRFEGMDENVTEPTQKYFTQNALATEHSFMCNKWRVDEKLFMPPIDVVFEDMSVMFEQSQEALKGLSSQCDSLPEAQRSACVDAMKRFAQ